MTTNGINNVDEADITECEGEKVVTMMDVLQEQQEFEEDANAVLGASDDKECTYSKGYIKRQAIYACLTCCSGAKDDPTLRAGVCLACSLNCHENHELIELYTKRNFRCDCGNPKFNSHPCTFTPNKTELNEDNEYNQNFSGIYCVCHRPYPDPEATVEDEMIQCIICEDWLHSNHLEAVVPANDLYAEMICKACMDKNNFLHDYSQLAVNYEADVDITTINGNENSIIVDSETTHLVNGKGKNSDINDVDMEKEESELKDNSSLTEEYKTQIEGGTNTNEESISKIEITTTDLTAKSIENLELEVGATLTMEKDDSSTITSIIEAEQEKPNESVVEDIKESDNTTQLNLKHSDSNSNEINTQDMKSKIDDENNPSTKTILEQNESITEQVLNPIKNSEEVTNCLEDNNTETNINNEIKEVTDACENESKDNNTGITIVSSALEESNNQTTDGHNNSESKDENKEVQENIDVEMSPKKKNDCDIDSLEAATKELSELMAEGETNQSINTAEINETNGEQKEGISDNKDDVSGMKDEDMDYNINRNKSGNENKISNCTEQDHKRKLDDSTEEVLVKKQKVDKKDNCLRPTNVKRTIKGAAFWTSTFRQKLCTCNECLSMYKDLSIVFLTDTEDTVTAYEALGKERIDGGPSTQYEKGLQALSSLDRVQQINALTEYNKMRDKLLDFLKSFKDRKEIVKEEDIRAFFAGMKPRREPDGVYFCR